MLCVNLWYIYMHTPSPPIPLPLGCCCKTDVTSLATKIHLIWVSKNTYGCLRAPSQTAVCSTFPNFEKLLCFLCNSIFCKKKHSYKKTFPFISKIKAVVYTFSERCKNVSGVYYINVVHPFDARCIKVIFKATPNCIVSRSRFDKLT